MFSVFSRLSNSQKTRPTSRQLWRFGLPLLLCALALSGTTWWALRGAQANGNRSASVTGAHPIAGSPALTTRTAVKAAVKLEDQQQGCTVNCGATVPTNGSSNQAIPFAATATTTGCSTQPTYQWDFGDGSPLSTQQNPSKTYTAGGTYNWRLTTTVSSGGTNIETVVGGVGEGAPAKQSPYLTPYAVAADVQNRGVYVLENGESATVLRFINTTNQPVTLGGRVIEAGINRAVVGGGGDELGENVSGLNVQLADAFGLAAHPNGNLVYFVVQNPPRVRALNISATNQTVGTRTVAPGNVATLAEIAAADSLNALAVNSTGDVFTASPVTGINRVYRVSPTGQVSNFAGSGATTKGTDAFSAGAATGIPLLQPRALAVDPNNNVYIADSSHQRVIRVDTNGAATLVTQFVQPATGQGVYPSGLAYFSGALYIALGNQQTIVRPGGNTTDTVRVAGTVGVSCDYNTSSCGDGGAASGAGFFLQSSVGTPPVAHIASSSNGLYIPDQGSILRGRVRFLNLTSGSVTLAGTTTPGLGINTIAGNGLQPPYDGVAALATELRVTNGVAVDANNNLWLADSSSNRIRFVNRSNSEITLFPNVAPAKLIVPAGAIVTVNKDVGVGQGDNTTANQMFLNTPQGIFITNRGLYIVETLGGGTVGTGAAARKTGRIRFLNTTNETQAIYGTSVAPGIVATIAGGGQDPGSIGNGGPALNAKLLGPSDIVVSPAGDIYIADVGNKAVRKISVTSGLISSVALEPSDYVGLALDNSGRLYAVDNDRNRVWRESAANSNSFSPMTTDPLIYSPRDVVVDANGNAYVLNAARTSTDTNANAHRIIRVTPAGAASVFAGSTVGFSGDGGPANAAKLNIYSSPVSLVTVGSGALADTTINMAINSAGEIFFSDINNRRIRRIASGEVTCTRTGTITISGDGLPPTLAAITPNTRGAGTPGNFTITATGTNYVASSVVRWNGQDRVTTFVSTTQLTAQILASDVASIGSAAVTVFTPGTGGGTSGAQTFTIQSCNPVPAMDSIAPNTIVVNTAFRVTVNGMGFRLTSVVRWEGLNRPTTYVSETQLTAQIPASDVANVGTFDVNVFTPEPCGGASSNARFSVTTVNRVPTLTRVQSPANVTPGGGSFVLTLEGTDFSFNSVVRWNGQDRPTTFISATSISALIPAADIASPTVAQITVFTPTPGGGVTTPQDFFVGGAAAAVSAASYARPLAPESISAMFGGEMATGVALGETVPLPTTLLGTTVTVRDAAGTSRPAPLFFVAPGQINFQVPPGTGLGRAQILVRSGDGKISVAAANIEVVEPALFTANASAMGLPSALALRVKADGTLLYENIAKIENGQVVAEPIDLGPSSDVVFIIAFGTGIRGHSAGTLGTSTLGGQNLPVAYAGTQGALVGLDQLNLGPINRALIGRGSVNLTYAIDGKEANVVTVVIK
jgi:uncharacterized protein (TIGR03437 family)